MFGTCNKRQTKKTEVDYPMHVQVLLQVVETCMSQTAEKSHF